eukprot:7818696-Pyramimonas_sp.AAC.1
MAADLRSMIAVEKAAFLRLLTLASSWISKASLVEILSNCPSSSSRSPSILARFCSGPYPPSKLAARGLASPELDPAPSIKPNVKLGI